MYKKAYDVIETYFGVEDGDGGPDLGPGIDADSQQFLFNPTSSAGSGTNSAGDSNQAPSSGAAGFQF